MMKKNLALVLIALFLLGAMLFAVKSSDKAEAPTNLSDTNYPSDDTPADSGNSVGNANLGPCYVGGCSSQICSDQPNMASTCEFREEYACYSTAKCERQASGQCGWTDTPELSMCLNSARQ